MPPKKDTKKQAAAKPDNSGIPKKDIEFRFNFKIKMSTDELCTAVMFEWFGVTSDKMQRIDTPMIDSWVKGQEQGYVTFAKVCDLIRVDDVHAEITQDFCKTLSNKKFYLYFVRGDDSKVQDMLEFDYSPLMMFRGEAVEPIFTFRSETIKVMGIDSFELTLQSSQQLLLDTYRHFLNPFEVEVIGGKNLPVDTGSKYMPAYVRYEFFDGKTASTRGVVGHNKIVWHQKHVFLAGLMDSNELRQRLRYGYMKFELHDRDQLQNNKLKEDTPLYDILRAIEVEEEKEKVVEEDPKKKGKKQPQKKQAKKQSTKKDPKKKDIKLGEPILPQKIETFHNNYGIAVFYLIDFLKPSLRTTKYKAPVLPRTVFEDFESKNIDLNTTARNQMHKIISSNNYFQQDTVIMIGFSLSFAIGSFIKPEQAVPEEPQNAKKQATKPPESQAESLQLPKPKDAFERVIYVMPYRSLELIDKIESVFYRSNMKAFGYSNKREITTHVLKPEEKQSIQSDYLTGIQLIDDETRIYIIEGLREGAMKALHQVITKDAPNTKTFKILKNSTLRYVRRLYCDFNIELKRLRFRPSLTQLLLNPSVYIKSKVSEQISVNLNRVNEIKKICEDLKSVDSMNLWPNVSAIVQIERKFSDSLSFQDINGFEQANKRKVSALDQTGKQAKTINFMDSQQLQFVTVDQFSLPKLKSNVKDNTDIQQMQSAQNVSSFTKKVVHTKIFNRDDFNSKKNYNMQLKKAQVNQNEPVYIYSGQKNNWYEKQMRDMRQKVKNSNGKTIYTYSRDYLGASIDPNSVIEQQQKDMQLSATKNISDQKFSSLAIKTKEQRMRLAKKPGEQDIQDMKDNPYYLEKAREKQLNKSTRGLPMHSEQSEFQKYFKTGQFFSAPEVVEAEKITPVQRFKQQQQQKKKAEEENRKKMLGDSFMKIKKGYGSDKVTGIDRFKDIREGSPVKKGIVDVHKKTKQKRAVENYEVSFMLQQQKDNPTDNPLVRRDNAALNVGNKQFNHYQKPEVLTLTGLAKPLKKLN